MGGGGGSFLNWVFNPIGAAMGAAFGEDSAMAKIFGGNGLLNLGGGLFGEALSSDAPEQPASVEIDMSATEDEIEALNKLTQQNKDLLEASEAQRVESEKLAKAEQRRLAEEQAAAAAAAEQNQAEELNLLRKRKRLAAITAGRQNMLSGGGGADQTTNVRRKRLLGA